MPAITRVTKYCALAWIDGLKPLHTLSFGHTTVIVYTGLLALAANIAVAVIANALWRIRKSTAVAVVPR